MRAPWVPLGILYLPVDYRTLAKRRTKLSKSIKPSGKSPRPLPPPKKKVKVISKIVITDKGFMYYGGYEPVLKYTKSIFKYMKTFLILIIIYMISHIKDPAGLSVLEEVVKVMGSVK